MRRRPALILALASLLALAGCGRKHQPPQQPDAAAPQGQQQSGGSLFSPSCPQLPLKSSVEAAIGSAMTQIYGPDEASAKFTVSTMTQGADCRNATVSYKASGTQTTAPLVYGDDDKWSVVLFSKNYPVQ